MGYLDYLQHAPKMLRKKGQLPVYFVQFITDACNAKCKHCLLADGAHPGWEEPSMTYRKQELTLEEIDKFSASWGKNKLMFLLPTGGEPFLRKDIGEIIKIWHKNTNVPNVGIPTNGSTTARTVSIVKDVCESLPNVSLHVDISIDGIGAKHDEIRVFPGLFKRSIETYKALREVEKHYKNFSVQVETTVSKHNEDDLIDNYHWLRENLDVDTVFTLLTRGSPKEPLSRFFNVEKYEAYADLMEKEYKSGSLSGYDHFPLADFINAKRIVRHKLIAKIVRDNEYQLPCYGGNLGGAMFANGDIYPCELLIDKKLGNVRDYDYDFKKIWFSRQADDTRKFIRESKCFCTYECFLTINILFNPRMLPSILKELGSLKLRRAWRKMTGRKAEPAPAVAANGCGNGAGKPVATPPVAAANVSDPAGSRPAA